MSARHVLTLLAVVATSPGVMAAGQSEFHCTSWGTYTAGSQFEKNLAELLANLSSAAAAGYGSFHSGSVGGSAAPADDQAWGLAMCYADSNATLCQDCLRTVASIGGVTERCPQAAHSRTVSYSVSDACLLRYADAPFLGSADTTGWWQINALDDDVVDAMDTVSMNATRWRLLSQLAERAAAVRDQPQRRLAYGSLPYTDARNGSQVTMYGLAQCTGDLEPSECTGCLMSRLGALVGNYTGATIMGFSCYLRYQVNDPIVFIGGPPAPSPQPATPSGSKASKDQLMIAALAAAAGAVMLLVAGV